MRTSHRLRWSISMGRLLLGLALVMGLARVTPVSAESAVQVSFGYMGDMFFETGTYVTVAVLTDPGGLLVNKGTVTIKDALGSALCSASVSYGEAGCYLQPSMVGPLTLTAFYADGSGAYGSSQSAPRQIEVAGALVYINVQADNSHPNPGDTVTITANFTYDQTTLPTGRVSFFTSGLPIAACQNILLDAALAVSCDWTVNWAGTVSLEAFYQGDADFQEMSGFGSLTAASDPVVLVQTQPGTPNPGDAISLTVTLTPAKGHLNPPDITGTMDFYQYIPADGSTSPIVGCQNLPVIKAASAYWAACDTFSYADAGFYPVMMTFTSGNQAEYANFTHALQIEVEKFFPEIEFPAEPAVYYGTLSLLSASVFYTDQNGVQPVNSGKLEFTDSTGTLCTTDVIDGAASCEVQTSRIGLSHFYAKYLGSANVYHASRSRYIDILPAPLTLALASSSPDAGELNIPITFTAALTPDEAFDARLGPVNAGTVDFYVGAQPICGYVAVQNGTASCQWLPDIIGAAIPIRAVYSQTGWFASAEDSLTQPVSDPAGMTLVITPDSPFVYNGKEAEFTVKVAPADAVDGWVTLTAQHVFGETTAICSGQTNAEGEISCDWIPLREGLWEIRASYTDGSASFQTVISYQVKKHQLKLSIAFTPSTLLLNNAIPQGAVTAKVVISRDEDLGDSPTGRLTVSTSTGGLCDQVLSGANGAAEQTVNCQVSFNSPEEHFFYVNYEGDTSFEQVALENVPYSVKLRPEIVLSADPLGAKVGEQVKVNAAFQTFSVRGGSATYAPQGWGAFLEGSQTLCASAPVNGFSVGGTCKHVFDHAGQHTITFQYPGNRYYTSGSATLTYTVAKGRPVLSAQPVPDVTAGHALSFQFNVAYAGVKPTGALELFDGSTRLCTASEANNLWTCQAVFQTPGDYSLKAVLAADSNYEASFPLEGILVKVLKAAPGLTLKTSKAVTAVFGVGLPVGLTVSAAGAQGLPLPDGTVEICEGSAALCSSVTLTQGEAACTVRFASPGEHILTLVYAGNPFYGGATTTLQVNVQRQAIFLPFLSVGH